MKAIGQQALGAALVVVCVLGLGAGNASASESGGAPLMVSSSTTYDEALGVLKAQEGVQTQESIEATSALASPTVHVEKYVDEAGEVISAVAVSKPLHSRAVWWESPGCSSTGACLTVNGRKLGYNGTGDLSGSWSKVSRISAGNRDTGLWNGRRVELVLKNEAETYRTQISGDTLMRTR